MVSPLRPPGSMAVVVVVGRARRDACMPRRLRYTKRAKEKLGSVEIISAVFKYRPEGGMAACLRITGEPTYKKGGDRWSVVFRAVLAHQHQHQPQQFN